MVAARSLVCLLCFGVAAPAISADREDVQKTAADLVRKLGNPAFRVREEAARDLLAMGSLSLTALKASINDPDVEIRERCRRLLPIALQADLRIQIAAFIADKEGKKEYDLPGWKRFTKVVGKDEKSREFYADMLKTHFDLMENIHQDPDKAASAFFVRCSDIYNSMYGNRIGLVNENKPYQMGMKEFAVLLFISADPKVDEAIAHSGRLSYNTSVSQMMYQPYFRSFLTDDKEKETFRKIFLDWLDVQAGPEPKRTQKPDKGAVAVVRNNASHQQNISAALNAIQNNEIKEATGFIERLINNKDLQMYNRAQAITTLGRIGTKEHIKMLEPLLKDETTVGTINFGGNNAGPVTSQMRDVALGITMHLEGQKPAEFDFDGMKQYGNMNNGHFYYYMFGFANDENRKKTYKKWDDFKAIKSRDLSKLEELPTPKNGK